MAAMAGAARIERTAAPLRQQGVQPLREAIPNGLLEPGQRLVGNVPCAHCGLSRPVVRRAMRQLESEQLIRVLPAQGPIEAVLSEAEIRAIYAVLADVLGGIHARVAIFRRFAFADEARVALSHGELVRIIEACAVRRDAGAAHDACVQHIRVAGELALIAYEGRAPGFRRG
jgi:DNA-binding GntR family transcriptional regulator